MTRDQIIQWAREAGLSEVSDTDPQCWIGSLAFPDAAAVEAFAALVAAHERERCLAEIEQGIWFFSETDQILDAIASAIRAGCGKNTT